LAGTPRQLSSARPAPITSAAAPPCPNGRDRRDWQARPNPAGNRESPKHWCTLVAAYLDTAARGLLARSAPAPGELAHHIKADASMFIPLLAARTAAPVVALRSAAFAAPGHTRPIVPPLQQWPWRRSRARGGPGLAL